MVKGKNRKRNQNWKICYPHCGFSVGKIIESSNTGKNYSASEDNEKAFAICTLEGLNELFTDFHKEKNTNFSLDEEQIEKIGKMLGN